MVALTVPRGQVLAQTPPDWELRLDGAPEPWPGRAALPTDSAQAARVALAAVHARGLFNAVVDSVVIGSEVGTAWLRIGPVLPVGLVRVSGLTGDLRELDRVTSDALVGAPLDSDKLQAAADRLLEAQERMGRPRASVRVTRLSPDSTGTSLELDLEMDPGSPVRLEGILVQGTERTSSRLVERLSGLTAGMRLERFDAADIAQSLDESGLFASVLPPVLLSTGDSTAIVQIVLRDAAPGSFDAALGFQPATAGSPGRFVGTGRLALVNAFGGGRRFDVLIDRLPGQVIRAELSASDPFFLSWPIGLEASFEGLQQDSTYGRQAYRLEGSLRLSRSLSLTASATRETARPGTAGVRVVAGRQLIPHSNGSFAGIGVRYRSVDRAFNPASGLLVDLRFERGWTTRRATEVVAPGDTTRVSLRTRAERLEASGRAFVPVGGSWVAVVGVDASVLVSPVYDRSDLFRIGGARTLRGYDEDRFEGRAVGRGLAEIRLLIDLRSYVFAFADLGWVDVPEGLASAAGFDVRPGYGIGLQLDTPAGLVITTYGFNTEDGPTNGRIHVAFSFGL